MKMLYTVTMDTDHCIVEYTTGGTARVLESYPSRGQARAETERLALRRDPDATFGCSPERLPTVVVDAGVSWPVAVPAQVWTLFT
jgi:hypothetical protein